MKVRHIGGCVLAKVGILKWKNTTHQKVYFWLALIILCNKMVGTSGNSWRKNRLHISSHPPIFPPILLIYFHQQSLLVLIYWQEVLWPLLPLLLIRVTQWKRIRKRMGFPTVPKSQLYLSNPGLTPQINGGKEDFSVANGWASFVGGFLNCSFPPWDHLHQRHSHRAGCWLGVAGGRRTDGCIPKSLLALLYYEPWSWVCKHWL